MIAQLSATDGLSDADACGFCFFPRLNLIRSDITYFYVSHVGDAADLLILPSCNCIVYDIHGTEKCYNPQILLFNSTALGQVLDSRSNDLLALTTLNPGAPHEQI